MRKEEGGEKDSRSGAGRSRREGEEAERHGREK